MGSISSVPKDSPLGCILSHCDKFSLDFFKQEKLIFFCNTAWPQYKLEDDEVWPENGSLNYNTILQLEVFCERHGKWTEIPYVQAFMALRENPELCKSCVREPCRLGPVQTIQKPPLVHFCRKISLRQKNQVLLRHLQPLQCHISLFILPYQKCSQSSFAPAKK